MWFSKKRQTVKYKRRLNSNARGVIMIDENGKEINRWSMLKDAASFVGVTRDSLRLGIKQGRKVKGYLFKYADDKKSKTPC